MKILFLSDIHSNFEALSKLEKYIENADKTFCLGDILGYYCQVNEVIDFLKEKNVICIAGNHDRYIISKNEIGEKKINESVIFGIDYTIKNIRSDNLEWLKNLPTSISFNFEGISILCCHGSPWNVTNEYLYINMEDRLGKLDEFEFNIIAFGHTHRRYLKENKNKIILNPGSVGQARDLETKVCAMLLDTENYEIEIIELDYDYKKIIELSKNNGAGDYIYKHLGGKK